jgi:hypothetical protein
MEILLQDVRYALRIRRSPESGQTMKWAGQKNERFDRFDLFLAKVYQDDRANTDTA